MRQPTLPALRSVLLRILAPALLLASALFLAGCGTSSKDSISGTVTMKDGKNVSGTVFFVGGGKEYSGPLLDGKYQTSNVPKGEYDVLVKGMGGMAGPTVTPNVPKDVPKTSDGGNKMGVPPPDKYAKPGALPKFTHPGGNQTHNITLDP